MFRWLFRRRLEIVVEAHPYEDGKNYRNLCVRPATINGERRAWVVVYGSVVAGVAPGDVLVRLEN
jgi:hypothetical protein